jgi:hypothetical protein
LPVTDDHLKALRALLAMETDEYEQAADRIMGTESPRHFNVILASAFTVAAHRRFAQGYSLPDIIQLVADQRTRFDDSADDFEPLVGEQLLISVLTGTPAIDLDEEAKAQAQIALLIGLVDDENLDDVGLSEFVEEARQAAERAMPQFEESLRGPIQSLDQGGASGDY